MHIRHLRVCGESGPEAGLSAIWIVELLLKHSHSSQKAAELGSQNTAGGESSAVTPWTTALRISLYTYLLLPFIAFSYCIICSVAVDILMIIISINWQHIPALVFNENLCFLGAEYVFEWHIEIRGDAVGFPTVSESRAHAVCASLRVWNYEFSAGFRWCCSN
jgi:hypothetical protein